MLYFVENTLAWDHDFFHSVEFTIQWPFTMFPFSHSHPRVRERKKESVKEQDYQVQVRVLECRQLAGTQLDPVCTVTVGNQKKHTPVKEQTNCPYWDEVQEYYVWLCTFISGLVSDNGGVRVIIYLFMFTQLKNNQFQYWINNSKYNIMNIRPPPSYLIL